LKYPHIFTFAFNVLIY